MKIKKWFLKFILLNYSINDIKKEYFKTKDHESEKSWALLVEKKKKIEEIEKHRQQLKWTDQELKKERKRLAREAAKEVAHSFVFN